MRVKHSIYILLSYPFLVLIKCYQVFISPLLGQNCRFYPTCSHYAHQAFKTHGPIYGLWLSIRRIIKCHPLNEGGIDHVPIKPIKYKNFFPLNVEQSKFVFSKEKTNTIYRINDN